MGDRAFIDGGEAPRRFSEVKAQRLREGDETAIRAEPWPFEQLVEAQQMACAGFSVEAIAEALGRPPRSVRIKLEATGYA